MSVLCKDDFLVCAAVDAACWSARCPSSNEWDELLVPRRLTMFNDASLTKLNVGCVPSKLHRLLPLVTDVDTSSLGDVLDVGFEFLCGCHKLARIDLSPLVGVSIIGGGFLKQCTVLTSVDLAALHRVTAIPSFFLASCRSLTTLDLSPLSNVSTIGFWFCAVCVSLAEVDASRAFSNVTTIGYGFFLNCSRLRRADLSSLSQWLPSRSASAGIVVYDSFFEGCTQLQAVALSS